MADRVLPRRRSLLLGAGAWLVAAPALAQPTPPVRKIGIAFNGNVEGARRYREAVVEGLGEHGMRVGHDLAVEARYADGRNDRYPAMMRELLAGGVEVIVVGPNTGVAAAREATSTVPIVMAGTADPDASGIVASLSQPGANVTGVAMHTASLVGKRLELVRALVPTAARVGYLYDPKAPGLDFSLRQVTSAFRTLSIQPAWAEATSGPDLDRALAVLAGQRPAALLTSPAIALYTQRQRIADFCLASRLPGVFPYREYADAGGLMSYAASLVDAFRKAGNYAARILAGANPATMPVEQPTRVDLVVNLRAADAIGLKVPASLLARADDVIR